jgi:toluene monooxygenase system protein D
MTAPVTTDDEQVKLVGPVIRGAEGDLADALIAAIEVDNPGAQIYVDDRGGYIRINVAERCIVTRESLEEALGRSFPLVQIEPALCGFAGRIDMNEDKVVWYLDRKD